MNALVCPMSGRTYPLSGQFLFLFRLSHKSFRSKETYFR